ncbi:TonB-dependent receptor plug domain-containing protein [Neptunomonas antarctica]|uniref:Iron complex outermembrane recepter protein n=1 Tax=Neptunomonas antarctica TaxID=619304 RepID=A0A1N7N396_9GAMM|nr:TonB-dependent receptor [Neptunomonas antarctica]SIS92800.1 iron complex outermembrane recepter protein [Neptunomonas antarctica]
MIYPRFQQYLVSPLFLIMSSSASAYNETDLFGDIPEITSATRITQNLSEVPVSTTIITQALIKASGALEITDLFKLVPGFQVYTPNANKFAVTYHGASGEFPRNLDVRIDGRPVYIPLLSTVTWNTLGISIHDIQRIEVVRGSNVPSYGSNALMGAINIITKSPLEQASPHIATTVGAQGKKNVKTTFSGKNQDLYYRVSLGHEQNDGFDFQQDGEKVNLGNIHLSLTPSLYDSIDFSAGFNNGTIGIGEGNSLDDFQDREHFSHFQYLQWNHVVNEKNELNFQGYHNYLKLSTQSYWASELLNDPGLNTLNSQLAGLASLMGSTYPFPSTHVSDFEVYSSGENGSTETYGAEIQHTFTPSEAFTVASGSGFRYEQATSEALFGTDETIDEEIYFLFSNMQWKQTEKLSWNAGFMSEFTSMTTPATSLRLASNYKINPSVTVRVALTQAYRTPSLLEENAQSAYIFPEGVPYDYIAFANDNLKAEKLNAAEMGLFWLLPYQQGFLDFKIFNERISHGIEGWFYEGPIDIKSVGNRIAAGNPNLPNDSARELRNTTVRKSRGFEIQASLTPTEKDLIHFAYSFNKLSGIQKKGGLAGKNNIPFDHSGPRHTATLLLNHQLTSSLDTSLIFNYMSPVNWMGGENALQKNIKTTDFKITKSFAVGDNQQLSTTLLIKNVFDQHYSEFQLKNLYDRRLYLTMSLDF